MAFLRPMRLQQPDPRPPSTRPLTTRLCLALLLTGAVLRLLALPLPGTGDVLIWKTWSYNAVKHGETTLYGVGQRPIEHRELAYGQARFKVDYPPVVLYELGGIGRLYKAVAAQMPDTAAFTVAVKLPSVLAEVGLVLLIYMAARRLVGDRGACLAALAYWLNPAAMLNASALGYLDPLFALPALAAVVVASAGSTWGAGALLALAVLTKAQGVLVAPVVALAVIAMTRSSRTREGSAGLWNLTALHLGETAAGAAVTTLVLVCPFVVAGTLPNMLTALATLGEHDMLSGHAANVWWIVTWILRACDSVSELGAWTAFTALPRILAISRAVELGYPNPRGIGLALMAAAWAWALWRSRRARDLSLLAGLGAFLVHAYFVLAAQVHENHLYLAIPLSVLAAVGRPAWGRVAVALSVIQALNLNLFYGFSEGLDVNLALPRWLTVVDAAVVLALCNCAVLAWHARVLHRQAGLSGSVNGAEKPR